MKKVLLSFVLIMFMIVGTCAGGVLLSACAPQNSFDQTESGGGDTSPAEDNTGDEVEENSYSWNISVTAIYRTSSTSYTSGASSSANSQYGWLHFVLWDETGTQQGWGASGQPNYALASGKSISGGQNYTYIGNLRYFKYSASGSSTIKRYLRCIPEVASGSNFVFCGFTTSTENGYGRSPISSTGVLNSSARYFYGSSNTASESTAKTYASSTLSGAYYAVFRQKYVNTYYDYSGASATTQTFYAGISYKLRTPTRTGYNFGSWYTYGFGSGPSYAAGYTMTDDKASTTYTFYGSWTLKTYTHSFLFYNKGCTVDPSSVTVTYNGTSYSLSYDGHSVSFSTTHDFSSTSISVTIAASGNAEGYYIACGSKPTTSSAVNSMVTNVSKNSSTSTYIYIWQRYGIYCSINGGSNAVASSGSSVTKYKIYGTSTTLPSNPTSWYKPNYTFTCWYTNTSGSGGTAYKFDQNYTANASLYLHALWTPNLYKVTAFSNGGYFQQKKIEITSIELDLTTRQDIDGGFVFGSDNYWHLDNQYITDGVYGCKVNFYVSQATNITFSFVHSIEYDQDNNVLFYKLDSDTTTSNTYSTIDAYGYSPTERTCTYQNVSSGWHYVYIIVQTGQMNDESEDVFKFRINDAWMKEDSNYVKYAPYGLQVGDLPSMTYTARDFAGWAWSSNPTYPNSNWITSTTTVKPNVASDGKKEMNLYATWSLQKSTINLNCVTVEKTGTIKTTSSGGVCSAGYVDLKYSQWTSAYNTSATIANVSHFSSTSVTTVPSSTITFTAHPSSNYIFLGVSNSSSVPDVSVFNVQYTYRTISLPSTTNLYLYFKEVSGNQLKYDSEKQYFYFEDGEYPQSYVGDEFNDELNNVTSGLISEDSSSSFDDFKLIKQYDFLFGSNDDYFPVYKYMDGEKYLKITAPKTCTINVRANTSSYTSITFKQGLSYWFKVEPIRWRVSERGLSVHDLPSVWGSVGTYHKNFMAVSDLVLTAGVSGIFDSSSQFYGSANNLMQQTLVNGRNANCQYLDDVKVDIYVVGSEGQQEKAQEMPLIVNGTLAHSSLAEIEECFYDMRAYASDLVCMYLGVNCNSYCDYWTRTLVSQNNAYIVGSDKNVLTRFTTNEYGGRLTAYFKEGSNAGG